MGLEAPCDIETGGQTHHARALLESHDLIVRGDLRLRLNLAEITKVDVRDGALHFVHGETGYVLRLPPGRAETWARKMTTPPPSLAAKLGISPDRPAFVIGAVTDPVLAAALAGNIVADPTGAAQLIIVSETVDALPEPDILPPLPVWIVYPKGAASALPEAAVRSHMRTAGWTDTKTSAVSGRLSALRFHRR